MNEACDAAAPDWHAHLWCVVEEVFRTMLETRVERLEVADAGDAGDRPHACCAEPPGELLARVAFRGPRSGAVLLHCSRQGAEEIARGLLRLERGESLARAEVEDALGECANLIAGSLKTRVLEDCGVFALDLPAVRSVRAGADESGPELVFRTGDGWAAVSIWTAD